MKSVHARVACLLIGGLLAGPGCDQDPPAPRGPQPLERPQPAAPVPPSPIRDPAQGLDGTDAAGRLEAAKALVAQGNDGLLRLVAALDGLPPADHAVRQVAIEAVAARIANAAQDERSRWVAMLARCGPGARPRLLQLVEHTDPAVRLQALEVLLEVGPTGKDNERILARAADPSPEVRRRVIDWVAVVKPAGARALLMRALDDEDAPVCRKALEALGAGPADAEIARALAGMINHEDPGVARAALEALEAMGPHAGNPRKALLAATRGASAQVRRRAVAVLARLEQKPAARVQLLVGLLDADHPDVRIEAARQLGAMGERAARARKVLERLKS